MYNIWSQYGFKNKLILCSGKMEPLGFSWELFHHVPSEGLDMDDDVVNGLFWNTSVWGPKVLHVWDEGIHNEVSGIVVFISDGELNTHCQRKNNEAHHDGNHGPDLLLNDKVDGSPEIILEEWDVVMEDNLDGIPDEWESFMNLAHFY